MIGRYDYKSNSVPKKKNRDIPDLADLKTIFFPHLKDYLSKYYLVSICFFNLTIF